MCEPYDAVAMRAILAADPLRPGYHFLPPCHWINDPNGLIHFGGQHHLCYQHNPGAAVWGGMTWGHAVSDDGLHWTDRPFALKPDQPYDRFGCFSGSAADDGGKLTLIYTGVSDDKVQTQCIATSDVGIEFVKHPANPVIPAPPNGFCPNDFRDPFVWRDDFGQGERWFMVVGSATTDEPRRGAALLYEADALDDWRLIGPIVVEPADSGIRIHECPNLFRCGDRWVLITSPVPTDQVHARVGFFDGQTFKVEHQSLIDYGPSYYAPLSYVDGAGRRLMYGWLREGRDQQAWREAGWAGALSLPRVLRMGDDGRLRMTVVDELNALRAEPIEPDHVGRMSEVHLTMHVASRARVDVAGTPIVIDREQENVRVDEFEAPLEMGDEPIELRIFIDRSVLEVFVAERVAFTLRRYDWPDRLPLRWVVAGAGRLVEANAWRMRSIWQ